MPSTTIARGNAISTFYIAPTLAPASVTTQTMSTQTFPVAGLLVTDYILPVGSDGAQTAGVTVGNANCLTAGVMSVQFQNLEATDKVPAAGKYTFQIVRAENLPLPATAV